MKSLSIIPMDHPWAWDMSRIMLENTWTPFEHPQGGDRADYETLSEAERFIFRHALAYLTTADVQIGNNAVEPLSSALTLLGFGNSPEVFGCLKTQAFQEWVHSMSYQHQLETILSLPTDEQTAIYQLWETQPEMGAKVRYARDMSLTLEESPDTADVAHALFWYYQIYEGGWFMGGFNPLFALAHFQSKIAGTTIQLRYIRRDESEHVRFGRYLLKRLPVSLSKTRVAEMVQESYELEEAWASFLFEEPILGYSARLHLDHFKFLMNQRCAGLLTPFPEVTQTPLKWLSAFTDLQQEANFFEHRVMEYRKGADLQWD